MSVLKLKLPMVEAMMSRQCTAKGKNMKETYASYPKSASFDRVLPRIMALNTSALILSKRSAACPAQSPTLSPLILL